MKAMQKFMGYVKIVFGLAIAGAVLWSWQDVFAPIVNGFNETATAIGLFGFIALSSFISGILDLRKARNYRVPQTYAEQFEVSAYEGLREDVKSADVPPDSVPAQTSSASLNPDMLFLSYSRKQFYFAESLTLHLQQRGESIWFDIQQLIPGKQWQDGIQAGLETCRGVILVASRAALASPYVQLEWEHALQRGKPVYIAVFEAVTLPDALKDASVIDFRGRFELALERLQQTIAGGELVQEKIPPPNILGIPTKLPPVLRFMVLFILLMIASSLFTKWLTFTEATSQTVQEMFGFVILFYRYASVVMVPILLMLLWRLLRRELTLSSLQVLGSLIIMMFGLYNVVGLLLGALVFTAWQAGGTVLWGELAYLTGWLTLLLIFIIARLQGSILRQPDILRWAVTGTAPQAYRVALNAPLLTIDPQSLQQSDKDATYALYFSEGDELSARQVKVALNKANYVSTAIGDHPDYPIVLISTLTSKTLLQQLMATYPTQLVCVLVSNVTLPDDLQNLLGYQWVDVRAADNRKLVSSLHYLREARTNRLATFSLDALPESLTRPILPPSFVQSIMVWRTLGVYCAVIGLSAFIAIVVHNGGVDWHEILLWMPLLIVGIGIIVSAEGLRRRVAGLGRWIYLLWVGAILAYLLPIVVLRQYTIAAIVSGIFLVSYLFIGLFLIRDVMAKGGAPQKPAHADALGIAKMRPNWAIDLLYFVILFAIFGAVFLIT